MGACSSQSIDDSFDSGALIRSARLILMFLTFDSLTSLLCIDSSFDRGALFRLQAQKMIIMVWYVVRWYISKTRSARRTDDGSLREIGNWKLRCLLSREGIRNVKNMVGLAFGYLFQILTLEMFDLLASFWSVLFGWYLCRGKISLSAFQWPTVVSD